MRALLRAHRALLALVVANLLLATWQPALARTSAATFWDLMREVLSIVPPVMVLVGLLDVWVPRRFVESHLGKEAGALGTCLAMLLGTAAAGPLYAAFPVASSLQRKGARRANVVVFLGTWASVKIPMIAMESSFVGPRFAMLRLAFTVPCIVGIGWLTERIVPDRGPAPGREVVDEPVPIRPEALQ